MTQPKQNNYGGTRSMLINLRGIGCHYNLGGYKAWPKVKRVYYLKAIKRLKKQGWIKESKRQGKVFLKLTKKGKIQTLLYKIRDIQSPSPRAWDGKWHLILFDIPESCKNERNRIRWTLSQVGFYQFQKSAYIYPYKIPVEVMDFLKESGLIRFIHFMEVSYLGDDRDLRRHFQLPMK